MWKGTVSLVTGGASGLGKATVERLVKNGCKVVVCDIQASRGQELVKPMGDNAIFSPGDVCSEEDVNRALGLAKEKYGRLDAVINCAGVSSAYRIYNFNKKIPHALDDFSKMLKVNTIGTFNVIRLAVGLIAENEVKEDGERGVIINTGCISGTDGQQGQTAYAASKAAIAGMTLPIARDLAEQGIRVVCIAPGMFDTPVLSYLPNKVKAYLANTTPFPTRLGKPEEFAHLVTAIMENRMLNGEVIRLDGAFRMFPI